MPNINEAYKYCEKIIANNSRTFYNAFSLLPEKDRNAVWAVYSFCRTVDDIVDEGMNPQKELKKFQLEFEQFLIGRYDENNLMWVALHDVFNKYTMDVEAFRGLLKGQGMDLVKNRYETAGELIHYCYYVASTVGLILLPILAPNEKIRLRDGAISLGIAMQLTNILRDVGEDLKRNRIYIPQEMMRYYSVSEEQLFIGKVNNNFIQLWEDIASEAEKHYKKTIETLHLYPTESRLPVKGALYLYHEILSTIRTNNYSVFNQKHYVSDEWKRVILSNI